MDKKREFKELCERKKEKENKRWEKMAEETRTESKVWTIINRDKKKKRMMSL